MANKDYKPTMGFEVGAVQGLDPEDLLILPVPTTLTVQTAKSFFESYKPIEHVNLGNITTSNGTFRCCVVRFTDEAAKKHTVDKGALDAFLKVIVPKTVSRREGPKTVLHLSPLPATYTDTDLRAHFEPKFGRVRAKVNWNHKHGPCTGTVEFTTEEFASKAQEFLKSKEFIAGEPVQSKVVASPPPPPALVVHKFDERNPILLQQHIFSSYTYRLEDGSKSGAKQEENPELMALELRNAELAAHNRRSGVGATAQPPKYSSLTGRAGQPAASPMESVRKATIGGSYASIGMSGLGGSAPGGSGPSGLPGAPGGYGGLGPGGSGGANLPFNRTPGKFSLNQPRESYQLAMDNIPMKHRPADLHHLAYHFGTLDEIWYRWRRGSSVMSCFLNYNSEAGCKQAASNLPSYTVEGQRAQVRPLGVRVTIVVLEQMPSDCTPDEVHKLITEFGKCKDVRLDADNRCAYAEFYDMANAFACKTKLHNHLWKNSTIQAHIESPKYPSPPPMSHNLSTRGTGSQKHTVIPSGFSHNASTPTAQTATGGPAQIGMAQVSPVGLHLTPVDRLGPTLVPVATPVQVTRPLSQHVPVPAVDTRDDDIIGRTYERAGSHRERYEHREERHHRHKHKDKHHKDEKKDKHKKRREEHSTSSDSSEAPEDAAAQQRENELRAKALASFRKSQAEKKRQEAAVTPTGRSESGKTTSPPEPYSSGSRSSRRGDFSPERSERRRERDREERERERDHREREKDRHKEGRERGDREEKKKRRKRERDTEPAPVPLPAPTSTETDDILDMGPPEL